MDAGQLLAVIVIEGNVIKNNILSLQEELDDETLLKLNILLNTYLNGLSIDEINLAMIAVMKQQAGIHRAIVSEVIDAVAEAIRAEIDREMTGSAQRQEWIKQFRKHQNITNLDRTVVVALIERILIYKEHQVEVFSAGTTSSNGWQN